VDLLAYGPALFFIKTAQVLLHGSGTSSDICAEKVDEHCFLFGVELGADPDFLAGVVAGVERDGLNRLSWFEVADVLLRVGRLFGEAI
jgi:hypothetical protein